MTNSNKLSEIDEELQIIMIHSKGELKRKPILKTRKYFWIILFLMVWMLQREAIARQSTPSINMVDISMGSPQAAELAKYGNGEVNMFKGVPNVTVPIYTIQLKGFELPIFLSYNAGGIKVDQIATNVGLGWVLQAGGQITATTYSLPEKDYDFDMPTIDLKDFDPNASFPSGSPTTSYTYASLMFPPDGGGVARNTKPDLFYYNFGGRSGKFMVNQGLSISTGFEAFSVPINDLQIKNHVHSNNGFEIIDEHGNRYIFGLRERSEIIKGTGCDISNGDETSRYSEPQDSYTWHLTEIVTTNNDTLSFTYTQLGSYTYDDQLIHQIYERNTTHGSCDIIQDYSCQNRKKINPYVLSKIEHSRSELTVNFVYDGIREDFGTGTNYKKLSDIQVTLNEVEVQNHSLTHTYFSSGGSGKETKRLRLDAVQRDGMPAYEFEYNMDGNLPARGDFAQDKWGFYNGKSNSTLVPNGEGLTGAADRSVDATKAGYWSLEKMTYPTGGETEFNLEADPSGGGLRVASMFDRDGMGNIVHERHYDYTRTNFGSLTFLDDYQVHVWDSGASSVLVCDYDMYTSSSVLPVNAVGGPDYGYTQVTINYGDSNGSDGYSIYNYSLGVGSAEMKWGRGDLVKERHYRADDKLLRQVDYEFESSFDVQDLAVDKSTILKKDHEVYFPVLDIRLLIQEVTPGEGPWEGTVATFKPAKFEFEPRVLASGWYRPTTKTETIYDPTDPAKVLTVKTESVYETASPATNVASRKLRSLIETNSDDEVRKTNLVYANEIESNNPKRSALFSVETTDAQDNILSKRTSTWDNSLGSSRYEIHKIYDKSDSDSVLMQEIAAYDIYGNPTEIINAQGGTVNYFFGSNGSPFSSAGHNGVNGVYLTGIRTDMGSYNLDTEADYTTLGQLSKVTQPDGVDTYYYYDSLHRLNQVKDDASNIVSEYSYNLVGSNISGTNPNFVESESFAGVAQSDSRIVRAYIDGLGRGLQTVALKGNNVIVSTTEYDDLGRHWKTWKPVSKTGTGLGFVSDYASRAGTAYGSYAYTETEYEASPLGRADKQIPMGGETTYGAVTTGYTVETVNGNEYAVTTVTDQEGNVTKTYTDGWGRTFRTVADPSGINAITEFVYDELDRVKEVRPPNYHNPPGSSSASDWKINYEYDSRGNLIQATSSDFGTRRYAYNKAGLLRYSQDANQAASNVIAYNQYDTAGRVTRMGIAPYSGNFDDLDGDGSESVESINDTYQLVNAWDGKPSTSVFPWNQFATEINTLTVDNEKGKLVAEAFRFGGTELPSNVNVSGTIFSADEIVLSKDDMVIRNSEVDNGTEVVFKAREEIIVKSDTGSVTFNSGSEVVMAIDGSLTGLGEAEVAASNPWMLTLYDYDSEGRVENKYIYIGDNSDWDAAINYEYNLLGELTQREVTVGVGGQTLYHHYNYNDLGQLVSVTLTIDGLIDTETKEIEYTYNPDGTVWLKEYQGGTTVTYDYDIQSRLTDINDTGSSADPFAAHYEYLNNGNIEIAEFRNPLASFGSSQYRYRYIHDYDGLNRLESADYETYNSGWNASNQYKVSGLQYDKQGNITGLQRREESGSLIDNLTYDYNDNGSWSNRLDGVTDAIGTTSETWDAEDATFGYDDNGNMTSQPGKITSISYDFRNLPVHMELPGGEELVANYNSAGARIIKEFNGLSGTYTYYLRDGSETLAMIDQNDEVDFNILGQGIEGRWGKIQLSGLFETSGAITSESESNNSLATADGPIKSGSTDGNVTNGDIDWYYVDILGEGTLNYSLATHPYYTPSSGSVNYSITIRNSNGIIINGESLSGTRPLSGSLHVSAGRYYITIEPMYPLSIDYYQLTLSGTLDDDQHEAHYYMKDHLGSTRAIVQDNGTHLESFDYYPFGLEMPGRSTTSTAEDRYKFTGHERDEEGNLGIDYMMARSYNPAIGRFMQIDPKYNLYYGWSPYSYTLNNPLLYTDPTGECIKELPCPEKVQKAIDYVKNLEVRVDVNFQLSVGAQLAGEIKRGIGATLVGAAVDTHEGSASWSSMSSEGAESGNFEFNKIDAEEQTLRQTISGSAAIGLELSQELEQDPSGDFRFTPVERNLTVGAGLFGGTISNDMKEDKATGALFFGSGFEAAAIFGIRGFVGLSIVDHNQPD